MSSSKPIAEALAAAFLAGRLQTDELVHRGSRLLGQRWRWLHPLAKRVEAAYYYVPRPRTATLATFLQNDAGFCRACSKHPLQIVDWSACQPTTLVPHPAAEAWQVPVLCTPRQLADWLGLAPTQLEWFADLRQWETRQQRPKARHYHYRPLTKRAGSVRMIEAPKPRLKQLQRQLLEELLEHIPLHPAVHGFRRGRSIQSFAAPHVGRQVVLKLDLQDFFPSSTQPRVQAIFATAGYPERVADLLAGLCINSTPSDAWQAAHNDVPRQTKWLYEQPHLPQGAPTSPALANLCAYRMDCRLAALAETAGGTYTRYADDLAFSGDERFAHGAERFLLHAMATVMEEGFRIHYRKTRLMRPGVCQRLAGLVVNQHLNVSRRDFDRLKATLTNCVRRGPESQNHDGHPDYRSHLQGRVAFVESVHPERRKKLRALFEQITW